MLRRLFFKATLVGFLAFFSFAFSVFSCDSCSRDSSILRSGVNPGQKEDSQNLHNINLKNEFKKHQQAAEITSQKSKKVHDAAQEKITNIRD